MRTGCWRELLVDLAVLAALVYVGLRLTGVLE